MYLRQFKKPKGTYLTICERVWDSKTKKSKEKSVKPIGYVEDFLDIYDDPIAHFKEEVAKMSKEKSEAKSTMIEIHLDETMDTSYDNLKNVGYLAIKRIYKELNLAVFWKEVASKKKIHYPLDKIFALLVFSRILYPASKKKTFENKDIFFEKFDDFSLEDLYHALDIFSEYDKDLQTYIYNQSVIHYNRDLSIGFFDCTNYYYDISKPDIDDLDDDGNLILRRYRKYGPEKNHRKDPIIEMGLLMDNTGIPLSYNLFPGNESEKLNMLPIVNHTRNSFGLGRIIIVADRGLNTSDNIYKLNGNNKQDDNPRDGYVYGQSIRGADKEFKEWAIRQEGFIDTEIVGHDEEEDKIFRHKSRIYPKKIYIEREKADGKIVRQSITVDQKQLVYYSAKYAKKQKLERDRTVARAEDLIAHPKKYDKVSAKGASGYVMNLSFDSKTGEIIDKQLILDIKKIKEEEKYDGYYSIVTSELKMSDIEIRNTYRGLAKIEETFKITKSEFDTRPIFVRTNEHIEGHFTTCFTALVIIRLLQKQLEDKYSVTKIINSLKKYTCVSINENTYQFNYYDEIIKDIGSIYNIDLSKKYKKQIEIRRLLKY